MAVYILCVHMSNRIVLHIPSFSRLVEVSSMVFLWSASCLMAKGSTMSNWFFAQNFSFASQEYSTTNPSFSVRQFTSTVCVRLMAKIQILQLPIA
jgi:hypothetical protein